MDSYPDIITLIPQRKPFVMVDELVSVHETTCTTRFTIRAENPMSENGFFSEGGLVENIAQTAAAHAGYTAKESGKPVQTGFIGAVSGLEITAIPAVGDVLETTVKIENQIFDVTLISGQASCKGIIVAKCEMKIFILSTNNSVS